ncbi:MAG: GNAT family N-acetyltransferase, partial [Pseudonocardia sp.]
EVRFHLPLTPFTRDVPVVRPYMEAAVRETAPDRPVFVAERAGAVLGYAACLVVDTPDDGLVRPTPPGRSGDFLSVGVRADARGTGVGTAIVGAAAHHLAGLGAQRVSAAFVPTNPLARAFWTRRGFRPLWRYWAAILD